MSNIVETQVTSSTSQQQLQPDQQQQQQKILLHTTTMNTKINNENLAGGNDNKVSKQQPQIPSAAVAPAEVGGSSTKNEQPQQSTNKAEQKLVEKQIPPDKLMVKDTKSHTVTNAIPTASAANNAQNDVKPASSSSVSTTKERSSDKGMCLI